MTAARDKSISAFNQLPKGLQLLALTILLSIAVALLFGAAVSYAFLLGVVATHIYMWTSSARTERPLTRTPEDQ